MNIAILLQSNTWYALIIGAAIGSVAAYIGSLMVTKRMTLMAGALGHLTLPGAALAIKYHFDISLGSFIFLLIGIFFIWLLEKQTGLPVEALTAIVFTTSVAIAFLFLPERESYPALLGDISQLTLPICIISAVLAALVFCIASILYKQLVLMSISPDIARTRRIPVATYNFIYLACIALVVALGVRIVGGLMTAALVAIPASTSKNVSRTLSQYAYISFGCGLLTCVIGIFVAQSLSIPVGPAIILASAVLFGISLFIK